MYTHAHTHAHAHAPTHIDKHMHVHLHLNLQIHIMYIKIYKRPSYTLVIHCSGRKKKNLHGTMRLPRLNIAEQPI